MYRVARTFFPMRISRYKIICYYYFYFILFYQLYYLSIIHLFNYSCIIYLFFYNFLTHFILFNIIQYKIIHYYELHMKVLMMNNNSNGFCSLFEMVKV